MPPDEPTTANDDPSAPDRRLPIDAIRAFLIRRFRIDTRSLAAIRIALGITLLFDLVHRAGFIEMFYTDSGVYPVSAYETTYSQFTGVSLHALSGALWFQQVFFVVAGLFAVAFIVGYRTRLVGLVSLLLLFSLQARTPAVLNGGDRLLRVLLLVALVTPLGERWSIDALRRGSARSSVVGFTTAALLLQPLVVFTVNAIKKHRGETWYAGDALEIALHNDVMTIFLGDILVDYPTLLTVLNYGWVTLLSGSVVFLLLFVGRLRMAAALVYTSAFVGMATAITVGLFPLALTASILPFLPGLFWDRMRRYVPPAIGKRRPSPAALGPLSGPPIERRFLAFLRDSDHEFAASHIVAYGQSLVTILGFLILVWMLLFSVSNVAGQDVPDEIDYDHLDQQRWGLYAPDPGESYSWYISEADLANGSTVDALEGGEPNFDRPPDAAAEYDTFRLRKFMQAVRRSVADEP
ncbi:MAG: HTTM domain-containing protein, partial [Natronomonas sp.]